MDQLSAHLDRGWDHAQRGDGDGAASSAQRAIEVSPDSPEAHNLLGYAAALRGECDEALEAYEHAIELDEGFVEAMLNAAELLVHPLGGYEEALAIVRKLGREGKVATYLNNIGGVYKSWGQYDKALKYYEEALAIVRKLGREDNVASSISNIGVVYYTLNQYGNAIL